MASFHPPSASQAAAYPPTSMAAPGAPAGILQPNTKIQVGSHRVVIERYLSEGGFAHVYVVRVPTSGGGTETAVLKRVAVPDKDALANMRTEVETMKKLKGHKKIVTYIDSHASQLKGGGYEVFLLMEFCDGGGLIDFMNTRLKNRLTEPEILKIFADVAEGVACMHYLKPPLLHRDLKVENILISNNGPSKLYKLCDFGSTAPPRPAAKSAAEGRLIEEDVQKHTTLQYRSPEMVDVYRKKPIDEKSDIWALGVLLYKLCYYTTPFEEQGQMAILTASFKYPGYPRFSDRLKAFIASMLSADPARRPNIYEVLKEACSMRGTRMPVKDIYAARTPSEARSNQRLPSPEPKFNPSSALGISKAPLEQTRQAVPDIAPMRRGRPTSTQPVPAAKPATAVDAKSRDPFAALDSSSYATRSKAVDELATKYPPAERFSLLRDEGSRFEFDKSGKDDHALSTRVTNALADEVFAAKITSPIPDEAAPRLARAVSVKETRDKRSAQVHSLQHPNIQKPLPDRPRMVSIGTMTDNSAPAKPPRPVPVDYNRPIWRVPPPASENPSRRDSPTERRRPVSQFIERDSIYVEESSTPSNDGLRPPQLDIPRAIHRSHSADEHLSPIKSGDSQHGIQRSVSQRLSTARPISRHITPSGTDVSDSIPSSVDYLRELEREDSASRSHHHRNSSMTRLKRASMPPISASAAKNMFAGKFGNAFKRFEGGMSGDRRSFREPSPDPSHDFPTSDDPQYDATDESAMEETETEDLSPEMRRELERRRLSLEERRVAEAAAAYRSGLNSGARGGGPSARASAIQNRVKTLLDESAQTSPVHKTAQGYGRYTDVDGEGEILPPEGPPPQRRQEQQQQMPRRIESLPQAQHPAVASAQPKTLPQRPSATGPKPSAPPKPVALRTGGSAQPLRPSKPPDLSSVRSRGPGPEANAYAGAQPERASDTGAGVDWEDDFSKRYPSLSLEQVETEISSVDTGALNRTGSGTGGGGLQRSTPRTGMRVRDV